MSCDTQMQKQRLCSLTWLIIHMAGVSEGFLWCKPGDTFQLEPSHPCTLRHTYTETHTHTPLICKQCFSCGSTMCGLKSSLLRGPPFSVRTSRAVSCCAYLRTSLVICLPPIVNLHKLTGNLKHSGKPYEQYNCEGPMCRSVRHCGKKKEWKRFYLFRSNLGHPLLFFFLPVGT